jgi:hypothetical protein
MADRTDPTDPANMTAQERLTELAAILAEGARSLRARAALPPPHLLTHSPPESCPNGLDERAETRLHGQRVNGTESHKM